MTAEDGPHMAAITEALQAVEDRLDDYHEPLRALLRTLARQMDGAGDEPSTRLSAAYLSALKELRRAIDTAPPPASRNQQADRAAVTEEPGGTVEVGRGVMTEEQAAEVVAELREPVARLDSLIGLAVLALPSAHPRREDHDR